MRALHFDLPLVEQMDVSIKLIVTPSYRNPVIGHSAEGHLGGNMTYPAGKIRRVSRCCPRGLPMAENITWREPIPFCRAPPIFSWLSSMLPTSVTEQQEEAHKQQGDINQNAIHLIW
jgi:hypothetical protein